MALARSSAARSGGGDSTRSVPQWKELAGAQAAMANEFGGTRDLKRKGADGYVSPETYKSKKKKWVGAGYSANAFDSAFGGLANPTHLWDYGLD